MFLKEIPLSSFLFRTEILWILSVSLVACIAGWESNSLELLQVFTLCSSTSKKSKQCKYLKRKLSLYSPPPSVIALEAVFKCDIICLDTSKGSASTWQHQRAVCMVRNIWLAKRGGTFGKQKHDRKYFYITKSDNIRARTGWQKVFWWQTKLQFKLRP